MHISMDKLRVRSDARPVNAAAVSALAESIAAVGLINPIRARAVGDGYEVIAGAHRLAACRSLGLVDVEAIVGNDDDLHAELSMIDENLCRAELSASERARQTARRKTLYEALHPETRHGGDQVAKFATSKDEQPERFTSATAKVVGISERAVQLAAERGEKVIDEVIDMIRGTKLDTGKYLDMLKRLPPNEQVSAAKRDLREARAPKQKKRAAAPLDDAETEEQWLAAIMRIWNRGSREWRARFLSQIDTPVMDRRFG